MRAKTTNWDAVLASAPINADAALARDGRGTGWKPEMHITEGKVRSHAPLPVRRFNHKFGTDLTGFRIGKLTVIGLCDTPARSRKQPASWVVRCVCGYYEMRKAKTLRDPEYAKRAACDECNYLADLKAGRVVRPTVAERTKGAA